MNEENLLSIYEFLGGENVVGPKDVYLSKMQDEEVAKKFYEDFSSDLGGDEAGFLSHIGVSGKVDEVKKVEVVEKPKEEIVAEVVTELDPSKMKNVLIDGQEVTIPETDQAFVDDYYEWKEETAKSLDDDIKYGEKPQKVIPEELYGDYITELGEAKKDLNWDNYINNKISESFKQRVLASYEDQKSFNELSETDEYKASLPKAVGIDPYGL